MSEPDNTLWINFGRIARTLTWLVEYERSRPAAKARETYLRSLLGLPPTPVHRDDEHERGQQ